MKYAVQMGSCAMMYRVFRGQADWKFILPSEFPAKRAAPLAEKNAVARHHVLRSLISLHNEHPIYTEFYKDRFRNSKVNWGGGGYIDSKVISYFSKKESRLII
jgi:hypothetical protein